MRASILVSRLVAVLAAAISLAGCMERSVTAPGRQPPYLAIVVFVDAPPEVTTRGPFRFRVRELSGQLGVDTTVRAGPADTVIMSVVAATYRIDVSDVPATCAVRQSTAQAIVVPPNTNTSLVRFFITCEPGLTVITGTDGAAADPDYLVTVTNPDGAVFSSVLTSNDTVRFAGIEAGNYDVTLRLVADNCVVTSNGGETVPVSIAPRGSSLVRFRIVCAQVASRPRIVQLAGSYHEGSIAYWLRATDPEGDITRSFVDVTDCNRRSILPGGGQIRTGFATAPNVARRDTALIVGAYDLELSDAQLANRCLAIWVDDNLGNVSPIAEVPLRARNSARAPVPVGFNARLNGVRSISVNSSASDPDGDYLGAFLVYLVRDGVLSNPNGQPDRVLQQPAGIIGPVNVELGVGIGFGAWNDYLGAILYLIDAEGNFTRAIDLNLFQ